MGLSAVSVKERLTMTKLKTAGILLLALLTVGFMIVDMFNIHLCHWCYKPTRKRGRVVLKDVYEMCDKDYKEFTDRGMDDTEMVAMLRRTKWEK